jgi:hypothetical protein
MLSDVYNPATPTNKPDDTMKGKSSMHRTLFKGLAVAASTAVAMMVCGIGQASAAQLEPAHHGSAHMTVAAADDGGGGTDVDLGAGLGAGLDLGLNLGLDLSVDVGLAIWLGASAGVSGGVGAGFAHNHR